MTLKPHVVVHNEVSADGRMDWYAGDLGLYYSIAGRLGADATLCGSHTILSGLDRFASDESMAGADETELYGKPGKLVVIDSRGRIGMDDWQLLTLQPYWNEIVALCSEITPRWYLAGLDEVGIEYILCGSDNVDLAAALAELGEHQGVRVIRVDSGGTLTGQLLRAGLIDEVSILIDPCIVGGESPAAVFKAKDLTSESGITRLRLRHVEKLPHDVLWLRYDVSP